MSKTKTFYYADSCVFIAYFNNESDRADICNDLFTEVVNNPSVQLITSVHTLVEVAHVKAEKDHGRADPSALELIEAVWTNTRLLEIAEYSEHIARLARDVRRGGLSDGRSLKPSDAVHLATAKFVRAERFFTYDTKLDAYESWFGQPITRPSPLQSMLRGF